MITQPTRSGCGIFDHSHEFALETSQREFLTAFRVYEYHFPVQLMNAARKR